MNKILTSVLTVAIATASLPVTALAADHSDPVTKNGERLKYNTPYYLKDKNLPHRGGVTVESWMMDNYVRFSDSSTDNGTPIIFENKDRTDGFIESDDWIRIKSTKVNALDMHYWAPAKSNGSVYVNNDDKTGHKIYGSSTDNSIGIGTRVARPNFGPSGVTLYFWGYKGDDTDKAWMGSEHILMDEKHPETFPTLSSRQTPFEVIEVNE